MICNLTPGLLELTLEQARNMISGGGRVLNDDLGALAVSTVRPCYAKPEFRTPFHGSGVPLVFDIDPPRAFR